MSIGSNDWIFNQHTCKNAMFTRWMPTYSISLNIYMYMYIMFRGMFTILSEYRIQHGAIGPLYVTSSYSTWIYGRGVPCLATDCPCDVWCRGLTTCLLHVGPPVGNRFSNTSWAVGLTYWIVYLHFLYFDICNYVCLDIISFFCFIFTS